MVSELKISALGAESKWVCGCPYWRPRCQTSPDLSIEPNFPFSPQGVSSFSSLNPTQDMQSSAAAAPPLSSIFFVCAWVTLQGLCEPALVVYHGPSQPRSAGKSEASISRNSSESILHGTHSQRWSLHYSHSSLAPVAIRSMTGEQHAC